MKHAYTLIEIIVGLGIIAILSSLIVFGIINLQKSARDSERTMMLGKINQEINNFQVINLRYPYNSEVTLNSNSIIIGSRSVAIDNHLKSAGSSSISGTRYYYQSVNGVYVLCIKLEAGPYQSIGNGNLSCPVN